MRLPFHQPPRVLSWLLLAGLLWLVGATPGQAQYPTRQSMPQGVVLVVKIVDNERLAPTTGVVVGRDAGGASLVVIPEDFATDQDEIIVLDGGTDVFANGKDAVWDRSSPELGLAVVLVEGLQQRPVQMTMNPPQTAHELRLAAFPGAFELGGGALPYWIPLKISGTEPGPQALLPGATAPNLTGPLIDLCGQWAGMVSASGTAGVNSPESPRIVFNDALLNIAELLNLSPRLASCAQVAATDPTVVAAPISAPSPVVSSPGESSIQDAVLKDGKLGTGALVFLGSAVVSGLVFWILVKSRARGQRRRRVKQAQDSETVTFSATGLPTRATQVEQEAPFVPGTKPPGSSGWLRIEGSHADGRPLRAVTAINEGKFKVTIGRAGVELAADGPGISRQHAMIQGDGGRMTITDLGSRNGTFVNGVRCQRDEIFFLNDGDKLLLGAAPVTVRISPARGPIS